MVILFYFLWSLCKLNKGKVGMCYYFIQLYLFSIFFLAQRITFWTSQQDTNQFQISIAIFPQAAFRTYNFKGPSSISLP